MRLLNTLHPTVFQKQVLAHIVSAATPKLASANIGTSLNLKTARDMLAKLGVITFDQMGAELTPAGQQLAQEENIVDASGQLTPDGQALLAPAGEQPQQPAEPQGQPAGQQPPGDPMGDISLESFSLLKELVIG